MCIYEVDQIDIILSLGHYIIDDVSFNIPLINCSFVTSFLSSMDGTKSTGLDCIAPRLLKIDP